MRKILFILLLPALFFAFQNFLVAAPVHSFLYRSQDMSISIAALMTLDQKTQLSDVFIASRRSRIGESKAQGAGLKPKFFRTSDISKSFTSFVVNHDDNYEQTYELKKREHARLHPEAPEYTSNDRSEIRLINSETDFTEGRTPQTSYSSFKFFIPARSETVPANNWALIWQCAQHGGHSSPPLSLHIENNQLTMVTYQDYKSGKPDDDRQHIAPLSVDRWYDVTIRYTLGEKGSYAFWVNGTQIQFTNPRDPSKKTTAKYLPIGYKNVVHNNQRACRISYGLYKQPSSGYFEVLFQGISLKNSYERFR